MSIEIREVKTSKDLNAFVRLPYSMYKKNPCYVPTLISDTKNTLNPKKNPAFEFCDVKSWLAFRDGKVAGRITGIINHKFIEKWKDKYARFGWIEFEDDLEVSGSLLGAVEGWAKENGIEAVQGPLGFTDFDEEGMLIQGFDEMGSLPMIYNFPYYPEHMEKHGYGKDVDWMQFEIVIPKRLPDKVMRVHDLVVKRTKLRVAKLQSRKDVYQYADGVFDVLNQAYAPLYGVTPLSDKQIQIYIKQYLGLLNIDFLKVIVNEKEEVVGFAIVAPSLSFAMRKAWGRLLPFGFFHILRALSHPESIDLWLVAIRPDYHGRGLNSLLFVELVKECEKYGVGIGTTTGQLEHNDKVNAFWRGFESRQHIKRRSYIKHLVAKPSA
jgi:GNAT superfamily N-acetyltransferase